MDIEDLVRSYRQYVQARIRIREIGSFGGGLEQMFGKTIAEHLEREKSYVAGEVARRAAEVQQMKTISRR